MSTSLVIRTGFSPLRSVVARANADLEHIFVIAGPSGSGKSTLMREFVLDRLPREISDYLPEAAKTWHRTSGNELSRKGLARVLGKHRGAAGIVVHYDIMRAYSRGFGRYENDPAWKALRESSAAITVLTVLPPREVLFDQFIKRARSGEYEEWWDKRSILRPLKRKLRGTFNRLTGRSPRILKDGHLRLLAVYGSETGLKQWSTRWEKYLDGLRTGERRVRLIYVAPDALQEGHPRFRLLRRV